MKRKSTSQFAFFNIRVLIGLFIVLVGTFIALAGFGLFTSFAANAAPAKHSAAKQYNAYNSSVDISLLPPGFDCSRIHELGYDKMENFRAGLILKGCGVGAGEEDSPSAADAASRLIQAVLPALPSFIGGVDVDVVPPDGPFPHVTESESMEWCGPNNTCVFNYNDSRTAPGCYSGLSYSTDGGVTWHASQPLCSGHGTNFGDPIVVYNAHLNMWFAGDLATGCGGQGIGLWTSSDGVTWTTGACAYNTNSGDRDSMWVDNNPASPQYGRMYISLNDFAIGGGALRVVYSDNGTTWTTATLNSFFIRDVQITGDLQGSGRVYVASMDEGGGGLTTRQNVVYRSTDGGVTWASSNTGPAFAAAGRSDCVAGAYFVCMFGTNSWRHMGWGEPAANGNVVGLDYTQHGTGSDLGDIYFVRSTDAGVTWGTPVKLNTDSGTALQWQPSMAATQAGTIYASWYDQREVNGGADLNCTAGSPTQNCYRRWGRLSFDNGATWLPDDMVGRALSPLPGQPDGGIQPNYQGDYDYHSSFGPQFIGGWTDGRVIINNQSQQDIFANLVQGGFGVTNSVPACGSVISTQPVDFVINLSAAVNTSTVQASDFTVNGTPSNLTPTFSNGNQTITFHFSSTPVVLGTNTMHIAAGAFSDTNGNPLADFTCTFCYAPTPLMVTSTIPAVGGTFSPPAPGDYSYAVNFNQPIDAASVTTSDLTINGNVGGSVTNVQVSGSTATFTVHFSFGGSVTLSIAAGSITADGCNGNAAFSGNYTVQGCPPADHYTISQTSCSIVPGTTDIGNHGDDQVTTISLPFSYTLYDQSYNSVNLSSNGNAQFTTLDTAFTNQCLPWTSHNYTILPYWDDLYLVNATYGIFTSVNGTAPNRIFNIEWRAQYYPGSGGANFELRLYEGQTRFDVIYGAVSNGNTSATAGVQKNDTAFDQLFCNGSGNPASGCYSFILTPCNQVTVVNSVSRKIHGGVPFDITLPGVECRTTGGTNDYTMVVTFSGNVNVTGNPQAQVISGTGCVGTGGVCSGNVSVNGAVVTVPLTNIANAQIINVRINGVNSAGDAPATDFTITMLVLVGDTNGNCAVSADDVAQTKGRLGQAVNSSNFRSDVNVNNSINAGDVAIIKHNTGTSCPP